MLNRGATSDDHYSQTFENKSSLPPNPVVGFAVCEGGFAAGIAGAALVQPPKSSSGATFGGPCKLSPSPPLSPNPLSLDGLPPHPKSFAAAETAGGGFVVFGFGAMAVGSGVAHASFEPHASTLENPDKDGALVWVGGADFGTECKGAAGADRLNADLTSEEILEGIGAFVGSGECEELEKLNESFESPFAGLGTMNVGLGAELKSPKPLEELKIRCACGACTEGLVGAVGFGGGFGPVSKNPPPVKGGEVTCGEAMLDRWLPKVSKPAKGDALG